MRAMKEVLLYIWQLPQHLLGLLLIRLLKAEKKEWEHEGKTILFWEFAPKGWFSRLISGCSLGRYIIMLRRNSYEEDIPHEHGHSVQSVRWGPLYLPVIGLPSALGNNLWDRLAHKSWPAGKRQEWYYSRWPEKQADTLGGVTRS